MTLRKCIDTFRVYQAQHQRVCQYFIHIFNLGLVSEYCAFQVILLAVDDFEMLQKHTIK